MSLLRDVESAIGKGDWTTARKLADAKIVRHPNQSRLHYYSGLSSFRLGELDRALDALRRSVALNDQDWQAGTALAQVLDRLLQFEEALEVTQHFLKVKPSDPTLVHLHNGLLRNIPEKITEAWQKSIQLDWHDVELTSRDG